MIFSELKATPFWGGFFYSGSPYLLLWWPCLAILVFLSFHPEYFSFSNFYDQKRILQQITFVFMLPLLAANNFRSIVFNLIFHEVGKLAKILLAALFFYLLLWVYKSEYPAHVILELSHLFSIAGFLLFFTAFLLVDDFQVVRCLVFFGLIAFIYLFKTIFIFFLASFQSNIIDASYVLGGDVNVNFIAQPFGMMAGFIAYFVSVRNNRLVDTLIWIIFISVLLLFVIADIRGVVVALLLVGATADIAFKKNLFFKVFCALVVALALFYLVLYVGAVQIVERNVESMTTSAGRISIWGQALSIWLGAPFLGVGPYSYPLEVGGVGVQISHPHNYYVQILMEWGVIGFALIGALFFLVLKVLVKAVGRNGSDAVLLGCVFALEEGVIHGGLSGVFIMPLSQTTFVVFLSIAFARYIRSEREYKAGTGLASGNGLKFRSGLFIIFVLLMNFCAIVVAYETSKLSSSNCIVNYAPRYWVDGGILSCAKLK